MGKVFRPGELVVIDMTEGDAEYPTRFQGVVEGVEVIEDREHVRVKLGRGKFTWFAVVRKHMVEHLSGRGA